MSDHRLVGYWSVILVVVVLLLLNGWNSSTTFGDDFEVSSGIQDTTVREANSPAQLQASEIQPTPHHLLSREAADHLAMLGVGVAEEFVSLHPVVFSVNAVNAGAILAIESTTKNVDRYTKDITEPRLILINHDAQELERLRQAGLNLQKDQEAREIMGRLRELRTGSEAEGVGAFSFMKRATVSKE